MNVYKCSQCGHENDLTRIFCQNCGTRLERTEVAGTGPVESADAPGQSVARHFKPVKMQTYHQGPGPLVRLVRSLVSLVILSALLAALIQILRAPDNVPAAQPANEAQAAQLFELVRNFASSGATRTVDIKQDQANNFLRCRVLPVETTEKALWRARFLRTFVVLEQDRFRLAVEQEFLGRAIYLYTDFAPLSGAQGTTVQAVGGGLGRLPLHPALMPFVQGYFSSVNDALSEVAVLLGKASSARITPEAARLTWGGTPPSAP